MGCQRNTGCRHDDLDVLVAGAASLTIPLDEPVYAAFARYLDLLLERNAVISLTSVQDPREVQRRHFVESLAVGVALQWDGLMPPGSRVVDVGAGAGFPGLPLRIVWPELALTLVEATSKKVAFLRSVVQELQLANVQIVHARAEDAAHRPDLRARFDLVVARAVAPLATLVELTLPFLRTGGMLAAVKGSRLEQELVDASRAISVSGGGEARSSFLPVPAADGIVPRLLLLEKTRSTPQYLPRRSGLPATNPLR